MSANNYRECPKCQQKEPVRQQKAAERAAADYGKVSAGSYADLLKVVEPRRLKETLREYYQIGIYDGVFAVTYNASCDVCDYEHKFSEKHPAMEPPKGPPQ